MNDAAAFDPHTIQDPERRKPRGQREPRTGNV